MSEARRFISIATAALLFGSMAATRFTAMNAGGPPPSHGATDPCSLVTTSEASTALGVTSLPGAPDGGSLLPSCVWSNDSKHGYNSPRIMLSMHSLVAFQAASHPNIPTITVVSISGIGDQAFFQVYPNDTNPFIWVRKGKSTFSIRLITIPPKDFTLDQAEKKEMVLAKAALGRL